MGCEVPRFSDLVRYSVPILVSCRQEGAARIDEQCTRIRHSNILSVHTEDLEAQGFFQFGNLSSQFSFADIQLLRSRTIAS